MAYMAVKMIIFQQFRHALTRHDPKTYPLRGNLAPLRRFYVHGFNRFLIYAGSVV